jgi:hypothetical protein
MPSDLLAAPSASEDDAARKGALARRLARAITDDRALGQALAELLVEPGPGTEAPVALERDFRQVTYRRPDGVRTNVTLSAALFEVLVERLGSVARARAKVRALALAAPAGVPNRSGWVADRLARFLSEPDVSR